MLNKSLSRPRSTSCTCVSRRLMIRLQRPILERQLRQSVKPNRYSTVPTTCLQQWKSPIKGLCEKMLPVAWFTEYRPRFWALGRLKGQKNYATDNNMWYWSLFIFFNFDSFKANISQEIRYSHSAEICIHLYCLSWLRQPRQRKNIQNSALWLCLRLCQFKISWDT